MEYDLIVCNSQLIAPSITCTYSNPCLAEASGYTAHPNAGQCVKPSLLGPMNAVPFEATPIDVTADTTEPPVEEDTTEPPIEDTTVTSDSPNETTAPDTTPPAETTEPPAEGDPTPDDETTAPSAGAGLWKGKICVVFVTLVAFFGSFL